MALKTFDPSTENPIADKHNEGQGTYGDDYKRYGLSREEGLGELQDFLAASENSDGNQEPTKNASVKDQEEQGGGANYKVDVTGSQSTPQKTGRFSRARSTVVGAVTGNKKGPAGVIVTFVGLLLLGGGTFFGGTLAPLMAVHNITDDLNDQLAALDVRTEKLLFKKFQPLSPSEATSLGCSSVGSALSIKCKYHTLSQREVARYKATGIEIDGDTGGIFGNRVKPTTIRFQGGDPISAGEFSTAVRSNRDLANAYRRANNMRFIGLTGHTFIKRVYGKFSMTPRSPELEGTVEQRTVALATGTTATSSSGPTFTVVRDENGNEVLDGNNDPYYTLDGSPELENPDDPNSPQKRFTQAEVNNFKVPVERVSKATRPLSQMRLNALRAVSILGAYDTVCSLKNAVGTATLAAKVSNSDQQARYAGPISALTGAMKSGDISNEDSQALQKFWNDTDDRKTIAGYDGTTIDGNQPEAKEIPNPNYGKSAMDSELIKSSTNGGVPYTTAFDKNFSLGFGADSLLSDVAKIAGVTNSIVNLGSLDTCEKVQSWWARGGGLAIGLVAGFFTGGTSTALTAGMFVAAAAAAAVFENILHSALSSSIITEDMTLAAVDRGTAYWTGMSVLLGQSAQARGMMPGNSEQIVAYQLEQNRVKQEYIALEREESDPLDIKDPHSLTGSIAYSLYSHLPKGTSGSALASLPTSVSSFVFSGLSSVLNPYSAYAAALDPERFKQCDDDSYIDLGIDADVQCNIRYVMPASSLNLDPIEVAEYMESGYFVEVNTTTGLPKGYTPPNPSETQSLAKDLLTGAINSIYSTRNYGDKEDGKRYEEYGMFLDFCVYRVLPFGETYEENSSFGDAGPEWKSGRNCLKTEATHGEEGKKIDYFRAYTFDRSIIDDLDESPIVSDINCGPSGSSSGGASGAKISTTEFDQQLASYGLGAPSKDTMKVPYAGIEIDILGYEPLLERLKSDPNAGWAAQQMLNGEKEWKAAGGEVKEYMNTGWLWYENGSSGWPDPYAINCNDARAGFVSEVSSLCSATNFQVAGYQAYERRTNYVEVFKKLYDDDELTSVLEQVVENSSKASKGEWNYNDPGQQKGLVSDYLKDIESVTLDDIAPNKDFFDPKTQFFTLMLGKDPAMAAALNSFAVTDSDVVQAFRNCNVLGWSGYICGKELLMSNMMMALYMFDGQGPAGGASCSDGSGGPTVPNSRNNDSLGIQSIVRGSTVSMVYEMRNGGVDCGLYDYALQYGLTSCVHTGTDILVPPEAPIYTPVSGTITCSRTGVGPGTKGGGCAAFNDVYGQGAGRVEIEMDGGDALILGHISKSLVTVGQRVRAGEQIGTNGGMNSWHVHVEYRIPDGSTQSGWRLIYPEDGLGGRVVIGNAGPAP